MIDKIKSDHGTGALIVGAGIVGLRAALNLAEAGVRSVLIDQAPAPGGLLSGLEKQFPSDHCGLCRILPRINRDEAVHGCLRRGLIHDRIDFRPRTRLVRVEGDTGRRSVTLETVPSGIDPFLCISCGACEEVCPAEGPDSRNAGLGRAKAVRPASLFAPFGPRYIDWETCTKCGECQTACPTGAVSLAHEPVASRLDDAPVIIWAAGTGLFDPREVDLYGAGALPNVITAAEYERLISPLGPMKGLTPEGLPRRPSDGEPAHKAAWIQCVGSRNLMIGADHCSSACCMFAVKEASLVREASGGGVDTAIFYMDMRTYGRDFQRYRDRAENELGVRFVRSRVHSLDRAETPGRVLIRYLNPSGGLEAEEFDLAVLSTGQSLKADGVPEVLPEGRDILTALTSKWLTDVSESLAEADALSARALGLVREAGPEKAPGPRVAPEPVFREAEGRVRLLALFVSSAEADVDWEMAAEGMPPDATPAWATFQDEAGMWAAVADEVAERRPDRLILMTRGPVAPSISLARLERETGLAGLSVEILDLNPWLESTSDPAARARGILENIRNASARLKFRRKVVLEDRPSRGGVLVVGGGPAGLSAALELADLGIEVVLVEKKDHLGGAREHMLTEGAQEETDELIGRAEDHPGVRVLTQAEVVSFKGRAGDFSATVSGPGGWTDQWRGGAAILAPGGRPAETSAYGLGQSKLICTMAELARRVEADEFGPEGPGEAVMILCAGSRREPKNYCSRVCCPGALETAIRIRKKSPETKVKVFYRDIMTYGQSEKLYETARRLGVSFIPFDPEQPPEVETDSGRPVVRGRDPWLGEDLTLRPDVLALAVGAEPNPNQDLARVFGLELTQDGFLKEADVKWRPVDSGREGVFVCGFGRAPARLSEARREGRAAAGRALTLLTAPDRKAPRNTAFIRPGLCARCLLCLPVCPYQARSADEAGGPIVVDPAACQGCGLCVAACPAGAIGLPDYEEESLTEIIRSALS